MSKVANLGYAALKVEAVKGTPLTPTIYVPLYDESLVTSINQDEDSFIAGLKSKRFDVYPGQRNHIGDIKVLAEPNTASHWMNMLLTKGSTTGAGDPYTHPFTLDDAVDPKSYTLDISKALLVERYFGAEAREIGVGFEDNKMVFNIGLSALKSFITREIESVATVAVTLKDNYDPNPTEGLVVGDLIGLYDASAGTFTNTFTVVSIDSDTVVTLDADASALEDGDLLYLRPVSAPSLSIDYPFLWSRTEFRFGANAAAALTAAHTPLEPGSTWKIMHEMANNEGEKRSGSFDPAELARLTGDVEFNASRIFDNPLEANKALTLENQACVIRHFSESNHELRLTLNRIVRVDPNQRPLNVGQLIVDERTYMPTENTSDGQSFDVKVINEQDGSDL